MPNLIGQRFNKLIVVTKMKERSKGNVVWECKCDCGNFTFVKTRDLKRKHTQSCGCLKGYHKHGHSPSSGVSPTYFSWYNMKARCLNKNVPVYKYYGKRGIKICDEWKASFTNFLKDMGERPVGKTLDRIDPNGNYERSNCRWATLSEQNKNKRR